VKAGGPTRADPRTKSRLAVSISSHWRHKELGTCARIKAGVKAGRKSHPWPAPCKADPSLIPQLGRPDVNLPYNESRGFDIGPQPATKLSNVGPGKKGEHGPDPLLMADYPTAAKHVP